MLFDDAGFVNVTGTWWQNKLEIWKAHDFGLRVIFQDSKLEIVETKVKMLSGEIAVVHAHFRLIGQTENEVETAGERETMFIFVMRKIAG